MSYNRPIVLSIAGFDPSGGAGVLADIKTIEQHACLGMAVNTALTNQTEDQFNSVKWLSDDDIFLTLDSLFDKYTIQVAKIGIVENLSSLNRIVSYLLSKNPEIKIVWDTVIASTSGFQLLEEFEKSQLNEVLTNIYLITPNIDEVLKLSKSNNEKEAALELAQFCHVLLKGGHHASQLGTDHLYSDNKVTELKPFDASIHASKHGSGCILSSAIASNLAKGMDLKTACREGKKYIEHILKSNTNLLAYHVA